MHYFSAQIYSVDIVFESMGVSKDTPVVLRACDEMTGGVFGLIEKIYK